MRYWIKLYTEILKDPKMGRLTDRQFRTCINLFALAGEHDQEGALPSVADMSWTLRMDEVELLDNLNELAKVGIVRCVDDTWLVCKWQERQAKAPSAAPDKVLQRVHEHRQRQRNETVTSLQDEVKRGVTPPETETETEIETEIDIETESERGATFTPGPVVARASVTRTTGTKPNPKLSPQVNLFAKVTGFYPARSVHHIVDAAIDTRNDEALLRQCYEAWLLRGFRKENLAWLTEWYTAGGIPTTQRGNNNNGHTRADTRDGYNVPAGYEDLVNNDVRTVDAPDPWRDLLAEADALSVVVRETPQVKERTLKQLARKLDGIIAALPVPYDAALAELGERLG